MNPNPRPATSNVPLESGAWLNRKTNQFKPCQIHRQLVKYHHDLLYKAGVLEKNILSSIVQPQVKGMPPKLALMSGWGEDSIGFGGGIHYTESGVNTGSLSLRALQPVEGLPLYLANEVGGGLGVS
eukprot:112187-Amorphochlora_amoeboformis.AAC.1